MRDEFQHVAPIGLISPLLLWTPFHPLDSLSPFGLPLGLTFGLTFGLGSGVAGLGGLALSQIGNVGPELGRMYIVDSFMVVVLGGVGKIAGTVAGALGIGVINKFLEPVSGAVLGKIIVLILIIALIQKRPQGLFALKGRTIDN